MSNKGKELFLKKKYLKISRLVAALIGMFVFIMVLITFLNSYLGGIIITSVAIGFLWYLVVDLMADRYESHLVEYEEIVRRKRK